LSVVAYPRLAAGPIEIGIGYLGRAGVKSKLSLVEQPAENDGIAGRAPRDRGQQHDGRFLNQHFTWKSFAQGERRRRQAAVALASRMASSSPIFRLDALLKAATRSAVAKPCC